MGMPVPQSPKNSVLEFAPRDVLRLPDRRECERLVAAWQAEYPAFAKLIARQVPPTKALRFFGLKLWGEGQAELAAHFLVTAVALSPDEAAPWSDLAGACYAAGRRADAAAAMAASLERNPDQPRGHMLLAMVHNDEQDFAAAETAYRRALALDPSLTDASFGLGLLCFRRRRFEEAAIHMRTAIGQGNETLAAWACLGQALYLLGDFVGAAAAFATQASHQPVEPMLVQKLALCRFIEAVITRPVEEALERYRATAGPYAEDINKMTLRAFQALSGYGHREAALKLGRARQQWAKDDPVERYLLAALAGENVERAPDDYLVAYFNEFADGFDQTLIEVLEYRVPEKLSALVRGTGRASGRILDLGCGTGLAAPLLRELGSELIGVDISPRMLEKARARKLYDRLEQAEFVSSLASGKEAIDLIFASDAFVYFGDLGKLVDNAASVLESKGLLAFNIETTDDSDFKVLPSGRFAHRVAYVEALAARDFTVLQMSRTTLRLEASRPVAGALFLLEKR